MSTRIVFLPPVPALLPAYQGRVDAIADLRNACRKAVAWLVDDGVAAVTVLTDPLDQAARLHGVEVPVGLRVARALLDEAGHRPDSQDTGQQRLLVLANGSGCRSEKAPGYLDPRSFAFDEQIETALAEGDSASLADLDAGLGRDLLATGIEPLRQVGALGQAVQTADLRYADDPYGVRYWVATWLCESPPRVH